MDNESILEYQANVLDVAQYEKEDQTATGDAVKIISETVNDSYLQFEQNAFMQISEGVSVLIFALGAVVGLHMLKLLVGRWFV